MFSPIWKQFVAKTILITITIEHVKNHSLAFEENFEVVVVDA